MAPSPASSFVVAADAPVGVLRNNLRRWAPFITVLGLTRMGLVVALGAAKKTESPELWGTLATAAWVASGLAEALGVGIGVEGDVPTVRKLAAAAARPAVWLAYLATGFWAMMACQGLPAAILVLIGRLLPVAMMERRGLGAVARAVRLALAPTGPRWHDRPVFKLAALVVLRVTFTAPLMAAAQLLVGVYHWTGIFLIYRDARDIVDGRTLEAAIANR